MNKNEKVNHTQSDLTPERQQRINEFHNKVQINQKERLEKLTDHLQAFNDAVIAIIATIIVLEIKPPLHETNYDQFLADILIFIITFLIIADFWYDLHVIFSHITFNPNKLVVIFDMLLLVDLALMPVMTKWIMEENTRFAIINFGIISLIAQILKIIINYFGSKKVTKTSRIMNAFITHGSIWRTVFVLLINLILIVLSGFIPHLAMILYILLPITSFIMPDLHMRKNIS